MISFSEKIMVKNTFIYVIIFILVGIAVWFFVQKAKNISNNSDINSVIGQEKENMSEEKSSDQKESPQEEKWIQLDGGLKYRDIEIGTGDQAKAGDVVATHYNGTFEDGTKFDSSYDRGQPFSFVLGGGMVIKGWDLGIIGMKIGGKRKLIIPPELGYGKKGAGGGAIPPDTTLYFEVELVDAKSQSVE